MLILLLRILTWLNCLIAYSCPHVLAATARAAAGGLALLSNSPDVCQRIVEEKQGLTIIRELLVRLLAPLGAHTLRLI